MSRSIHSHVSKVATNKDVLFNNRLSTFVHPPKHNGDLYISRNLIVNGHTSLKDLDVSGYLNVRGDSSLCDTDVSGNLIVRESTTILGNASVGGNTYVGGNASVEGGCHVGDDVDVSGNVTAQGTILAQQYLPGQVIRTFMYNNVELGQSQVTVNASSTNTIFSFSYTPTHATSYILLEYQSIYSLDGSGADNISAFMYVNDGTDNTISHTYQHWAGGASGGTRSGTIFPIVGRYTNTNKTAKTIRVDVYNNTDSDPAIVQTNDSTWLKITEIGR